MLWLHLYFEREEKCLTCALQGIIRRVQEDGPDRGNVDLDILPRSVRYRLRDVMDDVSIGSLLSMQAYWTCLFIGGNTQARGELLILARYCTRRDALARMTSMLAC